MAINEGDDFLGGINVKILVSYFGFVIQYRRLRQMLQVWYKCKMMRTDELTWKLTWIERYEKKETDFYF